MATIFSRSHFVNNIYGIFCARSGEITDIRRLQVYHKEICSLRSFTAAAGNKMKGTNIFALRYISVYYNAVIKRSVYR